MASDAPRRRPGRPPLNPDDPSIHVGVRLPTKQYDALYQRASAARMNVSEFIREQLKPVARRADRDGH